MSPRSSLFQFAQSLSALDLVTLPLAQQRHVGVVFADTCACILAGLHDSEVSRFSRKFSPSGVEEPITGLRYSLHDSALIFGFSAAALELDEGHYQAGCHPAAATVAATLAQGATLEANQQEKLNAFLAGYEAIVRIGSATQLHPHIHGHGTLGVFGAAVASAYLRCFSNEQLVETLLIAAGLAISTCATAPERGASLRSAWMGMAARNGITACDLVEAGVTPDPNAFEHIYGRLLGSHFDYSALTAEENSKLQISGNFMKLDSCCRETQTALAALDGILAQHTIEVADITAIRIETFASAAGLHEKVPANRTAARFSIPAVVSARLLWGDITPDTFSDEELQSPLFRKLCQLIELVEDPEMTGAQSDVYRPCHLRLKTETGDFEHRITSVCGDADQPMTPPMVRAKFDHLTADTGRSTELWSILTGISEAETTEQAESVAFG